MNPKFYTVSLCVNNEHGCLTDRIEALDVDGHYKDGSFESMIQLRPHIFDEEAGEWMGLPFDYEIAQRVVGLRIGGESFPVSGRVGSGGNWCWDSVPMKLHHVCRLLNHLKAARFISPKTGEGFHYYDMDQGVESWWTRWKDGKRFCCSKKAPRWFRILPRKQRRKRNRQMKRNLCLIYR